MLNSKTHFSMVGLAALWAMGCSEPAPGQDVRAADRQVEGSGGKADGISGAGSICSYDLPFAATDSGGLSDASGPARRYTADDLQAVPAATAAQIMAATVHLELISAGAGLQAAFEAVDDGVFSVYEVSLAGETYDWVRCYAGDTQIGAVFDRGTTDIVAEISDGEVLGCTSSAGDSEEDGPGGDGPLELDPAGAVACSYDLDFGAASSADLRDVAGPEAVFGLDDLSAIPAVTAAQIMTAAVHLEMISAGEGLRAALEAVDDNTVSVYRVSLDGAAYDWVRLYAGDTEIGAIFDEDTTDLVAEISDGEVLGCEPATPVEPDPVGAVCSDDLDFGVASSADLRDAAGPETAFGLDDLSAIPTVTAAQIVTAAVHLEMISAGEGLRAALEVVDDNTVSVYTISLDGVAYDWVRLYAGDTEIGAIFGEDTTDIVAEISDGEVLGCVIP